MLILLKQVSVTDLADVLCLAAELTLPTTSSTTSTSTASTGTLADRLTSLFTSNSNKNKATPSYAQSNTIGFVPPRREIGKHSHLQYIYTYINLILIFIPFKFILQYFMIFLYLFYTLLS